MGIVLALLALFLILSLVLLSGRGAWLIAGYNTMSPEEKARYDEKALCRSTGWMLLAMTACWGLLCLGLALDIVLLQGLGMLLFLASALIGCVTLNRSTKIRK